jgi:hypothetical protein
MVRDVLCVLGISLREPVLLLAMTVVIAGVLGAGRAVGLPLLFWHERPREQLEAGAASTMLLAEIVFVIYLIHAGGSPAGPPLGFHLALGGAIWLGLVGARTLSLGRMNRRLGPDPARAPAEASAASAALGVTPAFKDMTAIAPAPAARGVMRAGRVPVWPFPCGALFAAAVIGGWVVADARLGPPVERAVEEALPWMAAHLPPRQLHLHLAAVTVFLALTGVFFGVRGKAGPAVGLCVVLALFAAVYGFVAFVTGSRGLFPFACALVLWLAGRGPYRLQLPALAGRYPANGGTPAPYPPPPPAPLEAPPAPLLLDRLVSPGEAPGDWPEAPGLGGGKRPLILLATSGGGIRAAAWTAGLLGRLDEIAGFRASTRMVTGASGGMVGAAAWVARCHGAGAPAGGDWRALLDAVAADSLTPTARRLFFRDVPMAFWPGSNLYDRGRALEEAWIANVSQALGVRLDIPIAALRDGERRGLLPSLVFTPMLIEDGRRLVMSNLRLEQVITNQARWLGAPGEPPATDTSSRTAYHAAALFPDEWPRLPLSTAARLSAAFPYVSPAVVLPTRPRRRAVDAGYYDNYGLDVASGWLREALNCHPRWLDERVSGILVVQIRDNVSELSVDPDSERERAARAAPAGPERGGPFEGLSSPIQGLFAARDSVSLFRNDAQLETVTQLYDKAFPGRSFVSTVAFEFEGQASLSWYLTREEIAGMKTQVESQPITQKLEAITAWLAARGAPLANVEAASSG